MVLVDTMYSVLLLACHPMHTFLRSLGRVGSVVNQFGWLCWYHTPVLWSSSSSEMYVHTLLWLSC